MEIKQALRNTLDRVFPESPSTVDERSEIEAKVEGYMENILETGCKVWEKAAKIAKPINDLYRFAWMPYDILKAPLAFMCLMSPTSVEKNVEVLTNATAVNINRSVMPAFIYRRAPWAHLSAGNASSLASMIGNIAFLSPLVYAPGVRTFNCIRYGSGANTMDIHQIQLDIGSCLDQNSKIYQGPEAVVGLVTSMALGFFAKLVISNACWILLKDRDQGFRYDALNKIYTDVAMHLKNNWDAAVKEKDEDKMAKLKEAAHKILVNVTLVENALINIGNLTTEQAGDIKTKLIWCIRYIIMETGKVKSTDDAVEFSKMVAGIQLPKEEK